MKFWYSVSVESDSQPVETVRGELEATDAEDAAKRGLFRASAARVGKWRYRSLVVVVEDFAESGAKKPNKTKGPRASISVDLPSDAPPLSSSDLR